MTIVTNSTLSNSVRAQYDAAYLEGVYEQRWFDQFATPIPRMDQMREGTSAYMNVLGHIAPSTKTVPTDGSDVPPTQISDAQVQFTWTSRADAILLAELFEIQNYTNATAEIFKRLGESMEMSVDLVAATAALSGKLVMYPGSNVSRSALDAGTSGDRISRALFINAQADLRARQIPSHSDGSWQASFHPWGLPDLIADSGVLAVGQYSKPEIVLNGDLGVNFNGFRLLVDPRARLFLAAGAANGTAVGTTLAAEAKAGATSFTVASATNISAGKRLMIGTKETGTTLYGTNEWVTVTNVASTTITVVGNGDNGGLRYTHASGETVSNSDNVMPVVFGGPQSLGKIYYTGTGEFGQVIGPRKTGNVDQYTELSWKWYGGYGIIAENRILRAECALSRDA